MENDVIIFDVETTGIEPAKDQIIELCIQFGVGPDAEQRVWRIKPETPISAEAQKIHGISMDDLKDCENFAFYEKELREIFESRAVYIGYNLEFDLKFVQAEFLRCSGVEIELQDKHLVDPYRIWRRLEPRSLAHACQRFVGEPLDGAHAASEDVRATGKVLLGMLKEFELSESGWDELSILSDLSVHSWIGPSQHFVWSNGVPVFGFGKNRNRPVSEVAQENNGSYLRWMASSDFPAHVKTIAKTACAHSPHEFKSWLLENFGPAPGKNIQ